MWKAQAYISHSKIGRKSTIIEVDQANLCFGLYKRWSSPYNTPINWIFTMLSIQSILKHLILKMPQTKTWECSELEIEMWDLKLNCKDLFFPPKNCADFTVLISDRNESHNQGV